VICTGVGRVLFASALGLSFSAVHAQAQAGDFIADDCVNGLAQGPGSLQWLNNNKPYEKDQGEWNEGRQSGRGTQGWSSGRYDGELLNGEPHGRGVLTLQSARYEGRISQRET
jgi:hypothetical protein